MADSLFDMNKLVTTAIHLGNLQETQRRNDIMQQQERNEEARIKQDTVRLKMQAADRGIDAIQTLRKRPELAMNPLAQIEYTYAEGRLLKDGMGLDVPLPSREEMVGSYEAIQNLLGTIRDPNKSQEEKFNAMSYAATAAPEWFKGMADDMKRAGELSTQMDELRTKTLMNESRLKELNQKNAHYNMQQNLFTEHLAGIGRVTQIANEPEFRRHFQQMMRLEKPEARQAYLAMNPEFKAAYEKQLVKEKIGLPFDLLRLNDEVDSRVQAMRDLRSKGMVITPEAEEELAGYEAVRKARQAEQLFLDNPYDPKAWKSLLNAEQNMRILNKTTAANLQDVAKQRLGLAQEKLDFTKQQAFDLSAAQSEAFDVGFEDKKGLSAIFKKYPHVKPEEIMKVFVDPTKKGQLTVQMASPGERKEIADARNMLNAVDRIEKLYESQYVGKLDNLWAKLSGPTNLISEKEAGFRAEVEKATSEILHFYLGAAQTPAEYKRLEESLFRLNSGETQFKAALEATKRNLKSKLGESTSVIEEVGAKAPRSVPSGEKKPTKPMDDRFKELKQANPGMSQEQLFDLLMGEGY